MASPAFPYLLLPSIWSSRNRARAARARRRRPRLVLRGHRDRASAAPSSADRSGSPTLLADYAEFGDYLLRLGLSWLFLTFLSFLAFSGIVTALSTFFLSDDLRLLFAAPVSSRRLFHARFLRTVAQSSWMVVVFIIPVLVGVGLAHCAPLAYYPLAIAAVTPFVMIPIAIGAAVTLLLVNIFPARRARDILMLMGLLFAGSLVLLLRMIQPEQLLRVESLPDITDFFATLQSPATPLLPSFWVAEAVFAALQGRFDALHMAALWTTALGVHRCWPRPPTSAGTSPASARRRKDARSASRSWRCSIGAARLLPISPVYRHLLVKDLKLFLRDVSQWSQLLLLLALVLVYLYNFRVLDLDKIPYMSGMIKNVYAFVNLAMAGLVMSTVCARFVFPAVSAEGAAFWIIRTAPISLRAFLWSKFWTGLLPVFVLTEGLTIAANSLLGIDPLAAHRLGDRGLLHGAGAGRARDRPRRALSAVQRGESQPGRGLVWRRGVHDPRGPVHDSPDHPGRLAGVDAAVVPRRAHSAVGPDPGGDRRLVRDRRGDEPGHLVARHAFGRDGARGDGRLAMDLFQVDDEGRLFISPVIEDWNALTAHEIDVVIDMEGGLDECIPTKPGTCLYVYFPIFDEELPDPARLEAVAMMGAHLVPSGHRVLSHCGMGFNRSALVAGRILHHLGMPGADVVARLRERRPGALFNDVFADHCWRCRRPAESIVRSLALGMHPCGDRTRRGTKRRPGLLAVARASARWIRCRFRGAGSVAEDADAQVEGRRRRGLRRLDDSGPERRHHHRQRARQGHRPR